MPIHESDPWRQQYFKDVRCPPELHIPTDDSLAFALNPRHRWVYDKLLIAQSQGLTCGLPEVPPIRYPAFCKPITNLSGMGVGSHELRGPQEFRRYCKPGHFWMQRLTGAHVSTDWAVVRGEPVGAAMRRAWPVRAAPLITGLSRRGHDPRLNNTAKTGSAGISQATPACSTSRRSAGTSSKSTCGLRTSGPTCTGAPAGCGRPSVRAPGMGRLQYHHGRSVQRGAVRPARDSLRASFPSTGSLLSGHAGREQRADHF